jgi:hypothetical protein
MADIIRKAYPAPPVAKTTNKQGFQPGQSGNPKGRPQGSRNKATLAALAMLEGDLERITRKAIDLALGGDKEMIKLVVSRLVPPAKDQPVTFRLPRLREAADLKRALASILRAISRGALTPEEGEAVASVMNVMGLALEVEELSKTLEGLR